MLKLKHKNKLLGFLICGLLCAGCAKTPDYFKKHPEEVIKTETQCLYLASQNKNPFKNKDCQNVVLYEHVQCLHSSNYMEEGECNNALYLLSRSLVPTMQGVF